VSASDHSTPLLEATDLTVRFGKVTALDGLNLAVPSGEVLALLGPNGAGKTTFVRTIATLIGPTSGSLRVRGTDVVRDPLAVRRDIGLAGQYAAVEATMTGRENLVMTARFFGHSKSAADRAATVVIEDLSLEEDLGASLVGAPRLLLLDEPTTGLDPAGRSEVWDAVRNLVATGTDVLLTTHYLDEANELADRVVVIDHGKAIASGPLTELKASIGGDVIEVALEDRTHLEHVGEILRLVTANTPRLDTSARRASASATDGTSQLSAVIERLRQAAIPVDEIGLRHPTLDEVFLTLTNSHSSATSVARSTQKGRS
jgi:ABC-2 type transport system ATP-binding protein